jgi:hypothetical protein
MQTKKRLIKVAVCILLLAGPFLTAPSTIAAEHPAGPNRRLLTTPARKFAEVEIILTDKLTLADISTLQKAPAGDLELLDSGSRVRATLSDEQTQALVDQGADITVLRRFVSVEAFTVDPNDVGPLSSCSGVYQQGSNNSDYWMTDNTPFTLTAMSPIPISGAPPGTVSTCIDVSWEVCHDWSLDVVVILTDQSWDHDKLLWDRYYDDLGCFGESVDGITDFAGELVNQTWELWAGDWGYGNYGYIDWWSIKVYYEDPSLYCSATGNSCDWEHISNVEVGDISNATACTHYGDYTAMSTTMEIGTGYPITVTNGYGASVDECGIWVDWNQDLDFDDSSETIAVTGSPGEGPYAATITPPPAALQGDTRMRIRINDSDYTPILSPCGAASYGEVEDYTITVAGTPQINGDFDGDGDVDFYDLDNLHIAWLADDVLCDIEPDGGDGIVNLLDYDAMAQDWLYGVTP